MHNDPFQDRTILVTGASRGLGRAVSEALVARGAHVVAVARDAAALDRLRAETAPTLRGIVADLGQPEAVDALAEAVADLPLCGVINNAGVQHEMQLVPGQDAQTAQIDAEIAVNLSAPIRLTQRLLPALAAAPQGFVCNVTSGLALAPKTGAPVYCATKAGLRSFTRALRYQAALDAPDLLINEVLPALVETDMTRGREAPKDAPEAVAGAILDGLAARRPETWVGKARLLRRLYGISPALVARILR
ncbi:SDR family NAD(P)-dependent oxidoreductase [Shimia sediminis]|uniref:SDR family NAD(P)-dependent oxidoreductase n=1 Tax=Shimia sediminis TaxID=2497945 RepID=UPI0013E043D4|nr:SDR family NAD(P)-dependent oxidoreductase [Shimia sediminis]